MMDPSQYYGAHHIQQEAARRYHQYTGNKFWDDLIEIHHALGLTVSLGSAVAVAPLVQFFFFTKLCILSSLKYLLISDVEEGPRVFHFVERAVD